ncbi:amidohydrolase family protein [Mycobacterium sp. C31M]
MADEPRLLMISSDGHATARMHEYRDYMPSRYHDEFDAFCSVYREKGSRNSERKSMEKAFDLDVVEIWQRQVLDQDRLEGTWDAAARLQEMERAGVAAEVLFPDFGLPWELYAPFVAATLDYRRTPEQIALGNKAYNRWLVDFVSAAPDRFAGLAVVGFEDVDAALAEIRWAKTAGLRGIVMPMFGEEHPVFHERHEPIWSLLEDLQMPVASHIAISGASEYVPKLPPLPHPAMAMSIFSPPMFFFCHYLLKQLIWGGVLERHPKLQVIFTEQGSGWVPGELVNMDYSWEGSYLRRDVHEIVKHRPSEYFARQCHLGSSVVSKAEVQARHEIGLTKMTIGMDFPHPEGTWGLGPGHREYMRAIIGGAGVPVDEARLILGENAIDLYGFDAHTLRSVANTVGPTLEEILTPPEADHFPRGDVHKPLSSLGR